MATETAIQTMDRESVHSKGHNQSTQPRPEWTYRPLVDIFDTAEELVLMADVPGATPESIDVSIEAGILSIQADVASRQRGTVHRARNEYGVGGFHRRFEIDEAIDPDLVNAEYRDGTLTVHLPKTPQARRHRVPVSSPSN